MTPIEYLITLGLSAAPIAELRGGLPFALARGLHPVGAFFLAVAGNLLIVPFLLLGLRRIERYLGGWRPTARLVAAILERSRRKGKLVERLGSIGLVLLVAVPFPGTGAWTGAIAAVLLGIPFRRALMLIAVGVLVAGVLVLFASLGAFRLFGVT